MASGVTDSQWRISFDRAAQIKAGVVAGAFLLLFWRLLDFVPPGWGRLPYDWVNDADWSHGWIIPLFSGYLVYSKWDQIRKCRVSFAWVGLIILVAGLAAYFVALKFLPFGYPRPVSMMICLLGVIILLCGLPVMRYLWVPWLYLFFAVPMPKGLYFALTDPLRRAAATFATGVLSLVPDLDIRRIGSTIHAYYGGDFFPIDVADACSGMRSTIALCALGVAVAFLYDRPWWQRLILLASCIPIATFANFLRVLITTSLFVFVDEKYATGNYHTALGLVMLGLAFAIFSGIGWVLQNLFVEEDERAAGKPTRPAAS